MECHVVHDPVTRTVKVWWIERGAGRPLIWRNWLDAFEEYDSESGADVAPSFTINQEMFEALINSSQGLIPATDATVKHRDDAIATRDRLLAIIERSYE